MPEKIPEKCKDCKHRKKGYCRAYQVKISLIDPNKCKRMSGSELNIETIKNLYHCKACGYHSIKKNEYCPECEGFGFKNKLEYPWELSIFSRVEYDELMNMSKEVF